MSIRRYLSFAGIGWLAGVGTTLALGLCTLAVFPGILRVPGFDGGVLGVPFVVVVMLLAASLPALAGGLLGGRLPREGAGSGIKSAWRLSAAHSWRCRSSASSSGRSPVDNVVAISS